MVDCVNGIMPDIEIGGTEEEYAKIVDEKQRNAVKEKDRKMQLDLALAYLQTH